MHYQTNDDSSGEEMETGIHSKVETNVDGALKSLPEYTTQENEEITEPIKRNKIKVDVMNNKRALSAYADTYELEKFENKLLIIFNQVDVVGYDTPRFGTEKDVMALKNTFEKIGFTVNIYIDLSKVEILMKLDTLIERDFSDYGCVVVAVLTHGSGHGELMARDVYYNERDIIERLRVTRNPSLVTKPRILLIQACRGRDDMAGIPVFQSGSLEFQSSEQKEKFYSLPVEADMLVIHSSYAGKPSHRTAEGSWFIQTFCNKVDNLAEAEDLQSILTSIKRTIAIDHGHEIVNRKKGVNEVNKQMPVVTSTLIRKLYLRKHQ